MDCTQIRWITALLLLIHSKFFGEEVLSVDSSTGNDVSKTPSGEYRRNTTDREATLKQVRIAVPSRAENTLFSVKHTLNFRADVLQHPQWQEIP